MDDDRRNGATGYCRDGAGVKRPRPSEVDGGGDGGAASGCHHLPPHRPLSLLAGCALYQSTGDSAGDRRVQLGSGRKEGAASRLDQRPIQLNSFHDLRPSSRARVLQETNAPVGSPPQDTPPLLDINLPANHGMTRAQPHAMLHRGESQTPSMLSFQHFAPRQMQPASSNDGALLRPFGMSPEQQLNYAVMVKMFRNGTAQGNAAVPGIAQGNAAVPGTVFNQPQTALPANISFQAGINNIAGPIPPRQDCSEAQLNRSREVHGFQVNTNKNASVTAGSAITPRAPPGTYYRQHQFCNESLQLAKSELAVENTALNNGGLHNSPPVDMAYTGKRSSFVNTTNGVVANTHSAPRRNYAPSTFPTDLFRAQQDAPSERHVPLWAPDDGQCLSTQQCWLRRQIETFPACAGDIGTRGRNRPLNMGQVGIRCIHCKGLPLGERGTGSSYFPASMKSIYQSAQNMLTSHFKKGTCPLIPRQVLQQMKDAGESSSVNPRMAPKAGKSRAGGGKTYWIDSAASVTGLVDTANGIRYSNDQNYQPLESVALAVESRMDHIDHDFYGARGTVLTRIEDKRKITDFCYLLMSQFGPYCSPVRGLPAEGGEEWHSDTQNQARPTSIGIVCQFCGGAFDGKQSRGIFLSSKADTMSRNKNLDRLYNHLLLCAPKDFKLKLMQARIIHLPQSDRLKKGWKRQFFETVCDRLHASLIEGPTSDASSFGKTSDEGATDRGISIVG